MRKARSPAIVERRALRKELRAKLAELRDQLRHAIAAKKRRVRELAVVIRAERLALRERLTTARRRALEELRLSVRLERAKAREEWQRRRLAVRDEGVSEVARARGELAAARERVAAERAADRRGRTESAAHVRAERQQSDETVRGLILSELVPYFERVKARVGGADARSRAEAFLRHAEKHPEEVFALLEPQGEARIQEARAEIADVARAVARGQGVEGYAEKRAARIERMRDKSARLTAEAEGAHARARSIADRIPMGQPILVGHHSQRRHERDLDRMRSSFTKSAELADEAKTLERRARSAERGRAVSSDDPEAIDKLRTKLAALTANRDKMRAANAAIRAGGDVIAALAALGFREQHAQKLLEKDFAGRVGFPDYALRNAASEAGRVEKRIRMLEERAATPAPADVVIGGARISEVENRVRVTFTDVPPEAVRRALKSAGFRWAPSVGAWQRHASPGARHAAERVLTQTATT